MDLLRCILCLGVLVLGMAAEPAFVPWIPRQLDDWPALAAEMKAYADGLEKAYPTRPSIRAYPDQSIATPDAVPRPPSDLVAEDLLILNYWEEKGQARQGCGTTVVWRAAKSGAAEVHVAIFMPVVAKHLPKVVPDVGAAISELEKFIPTLRPAAGAWTSATDGKWWNASWKRKNGRTRTRDDVEGRAEDLRPVDTAWLAGPVPPGTAKPVAAVTPEAYGERVAAHAGVTRALERFKSGFTPRQIVVLQVKVGGAAAKLGVLPGDVIVAIDKKPVLTVFDEDWLGTEAEHVFTVTRRGDAPRQVKIPPGARGLTTATGAPDPGLAVLAAVGPTLTPAHTDAAVAMYALDQPDLAVAAIRRLTGKIGAPAMVFLNAWRAAANDDFGRVEALVKSGIGKPGSTLATEALLLCAANRERSGRFNWAWPEAGRNADFATMFRHLVKPLGKDERFRLLDGALDGTTFTVQANDRIRPLESAVRLLQPDGGVLAAEAGPGPFQEAIFTDLPERFQLTATFTITPPPDALPANHSQILAIQFQNRSAKEISGRGHGMVAITTEGRASFLSATLDKEDRFRVLQPLPLLVAADGKGLNTLRVIRIAQMQRIEINGHVALQGFLPMSSGPQAQLGLNLRTWPGFSACFTKVQFTTPPARPAVSDF